MKQEFKEINFENKNIRRSHFDFVAFEDILDKIPADHNQFEFHKISFYVLFLVTQNNGDYNLNFKDYPIKKGTLFTCLLYTSPSPRDKRQSRMPSSA